MLNLVELLLYLLEIYVITHILAHTLLLLLRGGVDLNVAIILRVLLLRRAILLASVVMGTLLLLTLGLLLHLATHAVELEEHKEWYGHDYYAENQQSDQERSEE